MNRGQATTEASSTISPWYRCPKCGSSVSIYPYYLGGYGDILYARCVNSCECGWVKPIVGELQPILMQSKPMSKQDVLVAMGGVLNASA